MVRSGNKMLREEERKLARRAHGVFMYIRACSISCTSMHSEFPKGEKETEERYYMPSLAGGKLFLHVTTRLPTQQSHLSSTGVPPITSHKVAHQRRYSKYL